MTDPQAMLEDAWRWTPHTFAANANPKWKCYPYLRHIGNEIAQSVLQGNGRLIINCPPRHGKSELVSFWTPVWYLDLFPENYVMLASYGADIAEGFGRKVRNEIEQGDACRIALRHDSAAVGRFNTIEGGGMYSVGVGGPLSGRGGHLMIIDDPYKNWEDSHSATYREKLREWYQSTFLTRLEPGGSIIIAMTRWADDDLCSWILEQSQENPDGHQWKIISLPATAEQDDPLGRKLDQALCPARYSANTLKMMRSGYGGSVWDALFQQRPRPTGSGVIYCNYSTVNLDTSLELRNDLPLHLSFDFNIDPGMHIEIGQYDNKTDLFTCVHEIYDDRLSVRVAMERFAEWYGQQKQKWPEIHVFGDASGDNQWAGTAESCYTIVRQHLNNLKVQYRVRVMNRNPAVLERINTFNEALKDVDGKCHYHVHPRCKRLIADFKKLKADTGGLIDKREHALSHASDAEGYRVHYLRPLRSASAVKGEGRIIVSSV